MADEGEQEIRMNLANCVRARIGLLVLALMASLAPQAMAAVGGPTEFHRIDGTAPCRLFDSRVTPPATPLAANTPRTFDAVGGAAVCNLPNGTQAISINLTTTNATADGDLSIYTNGAEPPAAPFPPSAHQFHFKANKTMARNSLILVGSDGKINLNPHMPTAGDHVDVIIDVYGYFGALNAVDDNATVTEDDPATAIDVLANDVGGASNSIASVTQPANGTVVITGGGSGLTYQPNANYCNTPPGTTLDTFTYTLAADSSIATVSVTVNCVDDDPVAVDDAATVSESAPATAVNVLANDTDIDGGPKSITSVTQPADGTVVITGGGTGLTYQPNPGYCNDSGPEPTTDDFTYTLTPGGSSATVSMTVTCVDDPPTAVADAATVTEDSGANAIDVLANDTDPDGGPKSVASVTQPANGAVVITGGGTGLTYQPNANYCNTPPGTTLDTFTYTLTPGSSSTTVTVTVTCVDDNPVAVNDSATVTEDAPATAIDVLANDTDVDGGTKSVASVTQPANGTVVITGGGTGLTYQPNPNYCNTPPGTTPDTFTYTLNGGSIGTVSVSVTCVDDDPVAVADSATVVEDSSSNAIDVLANDTDIDAGPKSVASVTQPANGSVSITGGGTGVSYTPATNYCNSISGTPDTFTYTLSPGGSSTTVSVTVTCADDAPIAVADSATVAEDSGANAIDVLANDTDIDGGPKSVFSVTQPANGAVVITGGGTGVTYAPAADYCNSVSGTPDTFTYTLSPGSSSTTVSVTVTCVNDAPVIDLDADDDKGTGGANFATTFTEGDAAKAIEDVDATVTDVDSPTLTSITVTLTNLLDPTFEVLDANVSAFPNITKSYDTITVPGSGILTISAATPQPIADFQTVLRTVTYLNTDQDPTATPRVINFVANDGTSNSNTATSTVTVAAVDDAPTAVADSATVAEDSGANAIDVLANDTDVDGGTKSVASVTQPANGSVSITGGGSGVSYTPAANYCNSVSGTPDTFTYTLNGGSVATVSVTVTCVDDNPTAVADSATVVEDSSANAIDVLANDTDPDGGPKSVASVTQPANGSVSITGGGTGVSYTPAANYCNSVSGIPDTFTYTLNGGSIGTVSVTVTCVDDNPVAVADSATVVEDSGANAINVLANDTDIDGGPKSVFSVTQPANGSVSISGGGTGVTYTPNTNHCNNPPGTTPDTFTYTLSPGSSSTTVSVTVTCVNDPPVANADTADINEEAPNVPALNTVSGNVLTNDTDVDGPSLSVSAVAGGTVGVTRTTTYGSIVINSNGSFTYTLDDNNATVNALAPGQMLTESFGYTASDGSLTSSSTLTVTIHGADDPATPDNDDADFIGNTELRVDLAAGSTPAVLATTPSTFGVLDGDTDPDGGGPITVSGIVGCADVSAPFDCVIAGQGTVSLQSNGRFTFVPEAGDTDATATFQYTLTGNPNPATVTLHRFERVWYVKNDAAAGGTGASDKPFNTLAAAGTASSANDFIFVRFGDGTTTGQNAGITLKAGQRLFGEHYGLPIPITTGTFNGVSAPTTVNLFTGIAGNRPLIDNTAAGGNSVTVPSPSGVEIRGVNLGGNTNAIDVTTVAAVSGTLTIRDNTIRAAGVEGIDVNLNAGTTGTLPMDVQNNSFTSTGNGFDARTTAGALQLNFSNNSGIQSNGTGVLIDGSAGGSITITGFANNSVNGNTGGTGVSVTSATFDSAPGTAGFQLVSAGSTSIGASGNGVGGSGMVLGNVAGDLSFADLDIFADNGAALSLTGTGAFTGSAGMRLQAPGSVSTFEAINGPAASVSSATIDLQLLSLKSTNSTTTGVSLTSVNGTFSDPALSGSTITNATGTDFNLASGSANVTYNGTITDTTGRLVSIASETGGTKTFNGAISDSSSGTGTGISLTSNTGATIAFTGQLTLSTGGNDAFTATGGGTVSTANTSSTLQTSNGIALNVANTTIASAGLKFKSINAGTPGTGPSSGIVLNNTGSSGGLTVLGTGGAGTGGTIQKATGPGISLTSTSSVNLSSMNVQNGTDDGINASSVTGLSLSGLNVTNNGNSTTDEGIELLNLAGTASIASTTVTGNAHNNLFLDNTTGTLTSLTITGSTFNSNSAANGNHGLLFQARGTSTVSSVSISGSTFSANKSIGLQVLAADTATVSSFTVSGSTFTNQQIAMDFSQSQTSNLVFKILNNLTITGQNSHAINVFTAAGAGTGGTVKGRIEGNAIGNAGVVNSGSAIGNCMRININGQADVDMLINNNTLRQCPNGRGIEVIGRNGTGGLDVTVTNNDVNPQDTSGFPLAAILVQSNCVTTCNTVRSDVRGNTVPSGTATDLLTSFLELVETGASTLQLVDTAPASADCTAQLTSTNTGSASASSGCALIAGPINTPP
jgi:VCBS repeat-containing protein